MWMTLQFLRPDALRALRCWTKHCDAQYCDSASGAATLYICGRFDAAIALLQQFSWGMEFMKINQELLDLYSSCKDANEVVLKQNEWLATQERGEGKPWEAKKVKYWENIDNVDRELCDDFENDNIDSNLQVSSMVYGIPGELPPSDDECDEYNSENDPELDKFGNIIENTY